MRYLRAYLKIYDEWDAPNKRCGLVEVKLTRIDGIVYWVLANRGWFHNSYEEIPKIAGKNLQPIPTLSKILARARPVWFLSDLRVPYEEYPL